MAFAQQQRKPTLRFSPEEYSDHNDLAQQQQYRQQQNQSGYQSMSDSDTDWHVISSALQSTSSPIFLSETESYASSTRIISDTDSDFEHQNSIAFLPSHDGTGTFLLEDSSDQNTTTSASNATSSVEDDDSESDEFKKAIHKLMENDSSEVDITLPHGGITPPSFVKSNNNDNNVVEPPCFIPTAAGLISQELTNGVSSAEEMSNTLLSDEANHGATRRYHNDNIKFTSKKKVNLDRIPIHHPGIPGSSTSAAILSIVWGSLRRLTNHLLENDTNTVDTLSTLMSEAVFEGCMPFSSHLHMEIDNSIRPSSSFFEGNIAI
ncbi:hypothetical protein BD408DRAFT_416481 [Parasitella parasitica]|nr:hypothetical protein BD408DRAFT_416481 [Parasitella parasitica]